MKKLKLQDFNNLTKNLSFCIYDICYTQTQVEQASYIDYINHQHDAQRLTEILRQSCQIIGANILNIAQHDYEPKGASVTVLISEEMNEAKATIITEQPGPLPGSIVAHLDKSHICVHTYPEIHPKFGLCTFRADMEVSTCGKISPLSTLNYLIHELKSDIVTIDYRVRGFTRDIYGVKHFIDHEIHSIQNFISKKIRSMYKTVDVNVYDENIFHTRMLLKDFELNNYLFHLNSEQLSPSEQKKISILLRKEMQEIYHGKNISFHRKYRQGKFASY